MFDDAMLAAKLVQGLDNDRQLAAASHLHRAARLALPHAKRLSFDKEFKRAAIVQGRGLHSSTSQLDFSAFYGIGGARRDCVARVKRGFRGCLGYVGCLLCQTRLKLSCEVDECKPLVQGRAARKHDAEARDIEDDAEQPTGIGVRPPRYCPPRHRHAVELSFLELHVI
jgi:hypothetical protein